MTRSWLLPLLLLPFVLTVLLVGLAVFRGAV